MYSVILFSMCAFSSLSAESDPIVRPAFASVQVAPVQAETDEDVLILDEDEESEESST